MGRGQGWHRWVRDGEIISLNRFGASAPAADVMRGLGFSVEAVVARVRQALAARRWTPAEVLVPAALKTAVEATRERLHVTGALERVAARDSALWGERYSASVARRLGWLDLPERTRQALPGLERVAAGLAADGARTLYLLGMGGSSLAPAVLREIGGNPSGHELVTVDTTDPERVAELLGSMDPASAAVVAVSKSGTTAETSALLEVFWEALRPGLGADAGRRLVAVTEPGTPLARLAVDRGFRAVLPHPVDVGGRYSALSGVGMLPAVWLGLSTEELLDGGERALAHLDDGHPAVELALLLGTAATDGWGKLAWVASHGLTPLGAWAEQLVAESTGKDGRGVLPVVVHWKGGALPTWRNTVFLSPRFSGEHTEDLDKALDAVAAAGHPVIRWRLGRQSIGEAFMTLELATALAGLLIGVNPFDEPDVVRAKDRARAALAGGKATMPPPTPDPGRLLSKHLAGLSSDDAVVLLAYLPERSDVAAALEALAESLSSALGVPVTAGFGPRYLHSTGQLHKGGPARFVPVVLSSEPARDLQIPGQSHTLGQLRWAQAMGDAEALTEVGRKVLHLHLERDVPGALQRLHARGGTN
jgi:glucose-6-phosphate isomerase